MNPNEIYLGVGMFIAIVLALVFIIMFAKSNSKYITFMSGHSALFNQPSRPFGHR